MIQDKSNYFQACVLKILITAAASIETSSKAHPLAWLGTGPSLKLAWILTYTFVLKNWGKLPVKHIFFCH